MLRYYAVCCWGIAGASFPPIALPPRHCSSREAYLQKPPTWPSVATAPGLVLVRPGQLHARPQRLPPSGWLPLTSKALLFMPKHPFVCTTDTANHANNPPPKHPMCHALRQGHHQTTATHYSPPTTCHHPQLTTISPPPMPHRAAM